VYVHSMSPWLHLLQLRNSKERVTESLSQLP
jgi:hypothetical protein